MTATVPSARADTDPGADPGQSAVRLLRLASFTSTFDRFGTPPLLLTIAAAFGVSLGRATLVATTYYLAYGLSQLGWGFVSDRLGRVRTMRLTLVGAGIAGLLASAAPSLSTLIAARGVQGALFAAVIPSALIYVSDVFPPAARQRPIASLVGASAVAQSVATLAAAVLAGVASWRWAFVLPALFAFVLAVVLRRLPEPATNAGAPAAETIRRVARRPWARVVWGLALVEGTIVLGVLTFLAPALESGGVPTALAGAVVAGQGVGVAVGSWIVSRVAGRIPATRLLGVGAGVVGLGIAVAALSPTTVPVLVASVTFGVGFPILHTTLQTWATDVAPQGRAVAVSLFSASLFIGSSIGTALFAPLADAGSFSLLFALAAIAVVPFGMAAVAALSRYRST